MASARKRVLRGPRATWAAKRRQWVCGPNDAAPKGQGEEADAVLMAEGSTAGIDKPEFRGPSGVREFGTYTKGSSRNLGRPASLLSVVREVPGNEGDEVNRDGGAGVAVAHGTDEAGEPTSEGPGGGKGRPAGRTGEGKDG